MATLSTSGPRRLRVAPKSLLFAFVGLMVAYVLYHNERFLIDGADPAWAHYQPFKLFLLPHGLAGVSVILIGPFQFSDRLRQRHRKLHRIMGRFYIAGAMILAPLGSYIQYFLEGSGGTRSFTLAAVVDAVLLMIVTGIAFAFILARRVQQHRQWMTRSYAIAMVFLVVRVVGGVTGWDQSNAYVETIVWVSLAFPLLVADLILQYQELNRNRPRAMA